MCTLDEMEWWFKSDKYAVTPDAAMTLSDAMKTAMREANNLSASNLFNDTAFFFIRTSNKISLNHFLFIHGFEEMDDDPVVAELTLLF